MNYLAHAYLSLDDSEITVGNIIGDSVKGKQYQSYPLKIQQGLLLHRKIDSYTDQHPKISEIKIFFREEFGLYSGVVVDILCDHLLAKNFYDLTGKDLNTFTQWVYQSMENNKALLPESWKERLKYMLQQDWLAEYQYLSAIELSFRGINRRIFHDIDLSHSISTFTENENQIVPLFRIFFNEILTCLPTFYQEITSKVADDDII